MTISDISYSAGLTPGNIVFYEKHDIIFSDTIEDGRRSYSRQTIDTLKIVRLLRTLGASLEDTKAVINKEINLRDALYSRISALEKITPSSGDAYTSKAIEICSRIRKDLMNNDKAFDIDIYFREYADFFEMYTGELNKDSIPLALCPIRRLLARWFDWYFYFVAWLFIIYYTDLLPPLGYSGFAFSIVLIPLVSMLIIEPLLLMIFTTTPGKWLLGLRVRSNNGGHLPFTVGFARVLTLMFLKEHGSYRYHDWFYYALLYQKCIDGETLRWEYDSNIYVKDERTWRSIAFAIECVVLIILGCFIITADPRPTGVDNKGEITIAEFVENYNEVLPYDTNHYLNPVGRWVDKTPEGTVIASNIHNVYPSYKFITDNNANSPYSYKSNDIMKGVYFTVELKDEKRPDSCLDDMTDLMNAFLKAQPGYKDNPDELENILKSLIRYKDFEFTLYGVTVSCKYTYSGYEFSDTYGFIKSDKSLNAQYKIEFTMTKNQ